MSCLTSFGKKKRHDFSELVVFREPSREEWCGEKNACGNEEGGYIDGGRLKCWAVGKGSVGLGWVGLSWGVTMHGGFLNTAVGQFSGPNGVAGGVSTVDSLFRRED